jgi:hypothetical protein
MSDDTKSGKNAAANQGNTWTGNEVSTQEELEKAANDTVDFLKHHEARALLKDFLIDTYKKFEAEKVNQFIARVENEEKTNGTQTKPFHTHGNIAPLLAEDFNMAAAEKAFANGLQITKKTLVKTVEERVEEINRLLSGIGGFNSQLKSCFARSTVVFMEEEDPKHSYRERLVFSINLPNYELKRTPHTQMTKTEGTHTKTDNERSEGRASWDDAINALAKIVESAGLKPRYCKNDRKTGRFIMRQDLRSRGNLPDEFFAFTLDYNTEERITELRSSYNRVAEKYKKRIEKLGKAVAWYKTTSDASRFHRLKRELTAAMHEYDYFVGTVPDPNQLDGGLLFLIEVVSHKDYHIVRDKMQMLMTKFILHMSNIASDEVDFDPDQELSDWEHSALPRRGIDGRTPQEYEVEEDRLEPIRAKKAA